MTEEIKNIVKLIENLSSKIDIVYNLLKTYKFSESGEDIWLDIDQLCDYLPWKPAKQTVYTWVSERKIPFKKPNKNLVFSKKEIDLWIHSSSNDVA